MNMKKINYYSLKTFYRNTTYRIAKHYKQIKIGLLPFFFDFFNTFKQFIMFNHFFFCYI